ncbi:putative ester cyclase [Nocardia transvalensis]|uniref:Putative ester cyclase n=1 Tax=Nocardia transvalensis TaxID=37333 RepID=A0A7W9P8W0_9NOCA|nr:ester cyclase [Nocardia transvalensis]MBB5911333.1 putative ester cyclase [Nocardia transvalensis]
MEAIERAQAAVQRAWTGQDWEAWAATCAEGYVFDTGTGLRLDLAGTLAWSKAWFAAFPDYTERVAEVHAGPDSAVAELVGEATSAGDFVLGGVTLLPATGRRFRLAYAKVLVFDAERKVVRDRQYQDRLDLYHQLGVRFPSDG